MTSDNDTIKTAPSENLTRTSNLGIASFAIARFGATFKQAVVCQGRVWFLLSLPRGATLDQIETDFHSDGWVCGRAYSQELQRLKGIVLRLRAAGGDHVD